MLLPPFTPSLASMCRRVLTAVSLICLLAVSTVVGRAADATFVGVLALAVEPEVAQEIGLSPQLLAELENYVDQRESLALEMALTMRDLPAEEQAAKLAAFRDESERAGLDRLDTATRKSLEAVRIRSAGFSSLADATIAEQLKLTESQRRQVTELLGQREAELSNASSAHASRVRENFERQLKSVLSPEQTIAWRAITGNANTTSNRDSVETEATKAASSEPPKRAQDQGPPSGADQRLQFSFRYAPWQNVIEWFADQCELSLLMDAPPQGTFNYTDPRSYSQAQAIDLLNSVLLTKGYTLIRRDKMLQVINLEDGIPPNFVTEVTEEELEDRGEYELVRCIFTLQNVNAETAREEIDRLLGPQGTVNVLASSNQLAITETAGRLRTFRRILEQGEQQSASALGKAQLIQLQHVRATKILAAWRTLMGLTEEDNVTLDGTLRVTQGQDSRQLLVSGKSHSVGEFQSLVSILDIPPRGGPRDVPQLEVYSITDADPESVLSVLDTLLEGADDIRLATDPRNGSLIALARPNVHETIRATIDQLQADRRKVEVIRLRSVDPQLAMLSIEKLFGPPPGEEDSSASNAPTVDADPVTRSLLIRGSETQIEDIRTLLSKMGEDDSGAGRRGVSDGGKLRMIPMDAGTARRALEQLHSIWPTVRGNRIRTVTPSSKIRGIRTNPSSALPADQGSTHNDGQPDLQNLPDAQPSDTQSDTHHTTQLLVSPPEMPSALGHAPASPPSISLSTATRYVLQELEENNPTTASNSSEGLPDVIVTIGEQGLLIASEDLEALDEFEELFRTLSDRLFTGSRELSIFYLRYAKAEVAAEFVKHFVGGASGGSGSSTGGTLLGNLAGAALGGTGGGIVGTLLGGGSSSSVSLSRGTTVIADPRLNALVVQATPRELDFIEELLQVLDRASSPEIIETVPRPRAIPVINADAEDVAEIVRSVYAARLAGNQSVRSQQPSPAELLQAISGQKNTDREISAAIGEQVEVTISVDPRRNALIVIAPESLFEEIQDLVEELDFATPERNETIRYGSVSHASPEMIRSIVESLVPSDEEAPTSTTRKQGQKPTQLGPSQPSPEGVPNVEEIKRRVEFLKALQKATSGKTPKDNDSKRAGK